MKAFALTLAACLAAAAPIYAQEADTNPAEADTEFPQEETVEEEEAAAAQSAADFAASLFAEEAEGEGARKTISWSGFIEPEVRSYFDRPNGGWVDSARPDARLELHVFPSEKVDGAVVGEVDLRFASQITPEVNADLRELWVRFYEGPLGVSMGRQIYTWGSILEFGVTDILNPQELPDLAQDAANRKIGLWSAKAGWDFGFMQAEVYAMPFFTPHDVPFGGPFVTSGRMLPLERAIQADAQASYEKITAAGVEISQKEIEITNAQRKIERGRSEIADGREEIEQGREQLEQSLTTLSGMPSSATTESQKAAVYAQIAALETELQALERQAAALETQQATLDMNRMQIAQGKANFESQLAGMRPAYEAALRAPIRHAPPRDLRGMEAAARLFFPLEFGDFGLGVARLHDRVGTMRFVSSAESGGLPQLHMTFPKATAWTLSGAVPLGSFTLRLEELYVHTADPDGDQAFVRNPTLQSAAQLQWDPTSAWQVRVGIQDEQILKVDNARERADEYSLPSPLGSVLLLIAPHIAHTAVTYRFGDALHQLTAAYLVSYESNGHFIAPEADIGIVEGIRLKAGAQFFLGDDAKPGFGQLDDFDNVWASLRVGF